MKAAIGKHSGSHKENDSFHFLIETNDLLKAAHLTLKNVCQKLCGDAALISSLTLRPKYNSITHLCLRRFGWSFLLKILIE